MFTGITVRLSDTGGSETRPHKVRLNGGEGDRTPDLVNAIHALSQLSYAPIIFSRPRFPEARKQHGKLVPARMRVKHSAAFCVSFPGLEGFHE
jgi:hypothetical protein